MTLAQIWLLSSVTVSAYGNFYFATHDTYKTSAYSTSAIEGLKLSGDIITVTQQCRRLCAEKPYCKAYVITLDSGNSSIGKFTCQFYSNNACDWRNMPLQKVAPSPFLRTWDKLEAPNLGAKPCVEYCDVKYSGNCFACRGYEGLSGFDCDIAPRVCADYGYTSIAWKFLPLWPWGFYRRKIYAVCLDQETSLFRNLQNTTVNGRDFYVLGSGAYQTITNLASYTEWVKGIDWSVLAHVQSFSKSKNLAIRMHFSGSDSTDVYSGLELSSSGTLSLNGSVKSPPRAYFPVPLKRAPFKYQPTGYGLDCGAFWLLSNTTNVCAYRTHLFSLGRLRLDNAYSTTESHVSLSFL